MDGIKWYKSTGGKFFATLCHEILDFEAKKQQRGQGQGSATPTTARGLSTKARSWGDVVEGSSRSTLRSD